jgi:hypothetical protein
MNVGFACKFTVGRAGGATGVGGGGGGACGAGFLLQAAPRATIMSKVLNRALAFVRFRIFLHSSFYNLPEHLDRVQLGTFSETLSQNRVAAKAVISATS